MASIFDRLEDGLLAMSDLEDSLDDAGVRYDAISWDHYDVSIELHGVADDYRLSVEAQKVIHAAGFYIAYVNHKNKWETHYRFNPKEEFKESSGWRISYPHKRQDGDHRYWVEGEKPSGWGTKIADDLVKVFPKT